jgi:predicted secreted protein
MRWSILVLSGVLALGGCGESQSPPPAAAAEQKPPRETVFDPLTSTIGRAEGVQQTVDEQAAEQRKRIEDAER